MQLVNLRTDSAIQWLFNGANIANATNATLELSSVTTNHNSTARDRMSVES